jgi:thiol:disulfide interchange protein DsbD
MRSFLSLIIGIAISFTSFGQLKDPVKWSTTSKKTGDVYVVTLTASLPKPWHIYSQNTGKGGPLPTKVKFTNNPLLSFQGDVKEVGKLKEDYDKNFDTKVKYYGDKVDFVQTVKVKGNIKTNVNVTVEYMTCNDEQCLPPTKKTFNVSL